MVKILSDSNNLFNSSEQKSSANEFKTDDPPLEEIDPAILSCGLPAIILSDVQPLFPIPPTRYTFSQLLAIRKSALSLQRPAAADDPNLSQHAIWKSKTQLPRGCASFSLNRKDPKDDDLNTRIKAMKTKDKLQERLPINNNQNSRESIFVAPRYRRNNEFVHRNHHVIVKSYKRDEFRLQDTVIEEEPEWVTSGPTSRLDTIELRGFDEDSKQTGLSNSESSLEKGIEDTTKSVPEAVSKYISFYDDLHHYEHLHPKRGTSLQKHDTSARENDVESVTTCTSSTGSPPPARSTPTKKIADFNNMEQSKIDDREYKRHIQNNGININNFEEFMKFDSLLTTENAASASANGGSRFSKWFRRNNSSINQTSGLNGDLRRLQLNENNNYGVNQNVRYSHDRQQQTRVGYNNKGFQSDPLDINSSMPSNTTLAYKQLINMINQNRVNNNLLAQQQYLWQLINKTQQSDALRNMVMKNQEESNTDKSKSPPQHRIPTHRELQFHTQTIMQNALLRKKIQDTHKILAEQTSQLAAVACAGEPNPIVQQFVQSVSPNMQRSLSVLSQTATSTGQSRQFNNSYLPESNGNNSLFAGGSQFYDSSMQQMLQSQRSAGNGRRPGKSSILWN